jgi:hypothetical protein
MEQILQHIVLFGVQAAAICALFCILFINSPIRWPMRLLTLALGALAIGLPLYSMFGTLGFPDPWPKPGHYDVLGWKFDEARRAIYAFVKKPEEPRPRLYKVHFDLKTALDLQEAREHPEHLARIGMRVIRKDEGPPDVAFDFEKKTVIVSPAELAAREQEERAARQEQLEQERREETGGGADK